MLVKICGLTEPGNLQEIISCMPDYVGFIFYPPSPRSVSVDEAKSLSALLPATIKSVGVFVDEDASVIMDIVQAVGLSSVQLHGDTIFNTAQKLSERNFKGELIGSIPARLNTFEKLSDKKDSFSFYLFDTPTEGHGGSGRSFDWELLDAYKGSKPFFLSGGIGPDTIDVALSLKDQRLIGIDLNSRLEISPGIKDIKKTRICIEKVRYVKR